MEMLDNIPITIIIIGLAIIALVDMLWLRRP